MLQPLQNDERIAVLRKRYDAVRELSKRASVIVNGIADPYTEQLDTCVEQLDNMLDQIRDKTRKDFSDQELQRVVLRLPILIYRAVSILDTAAIEASVSKAANKTVYAEYYLDTEGTIPEREAFATLKSAEESVIVDLARHVYQRVKGKVEAAQIIQEAIKKVMTSRDTEKQTFGRSNV